MGKIHKIWHLEYRDQELPQYIQIVNLGNFGFAIWDFPHTHTFYPSQHRHIDDAIAEAIFNKYEPVCEYGRALIMRNTEWEK